MKTLLSATVIAVVALILLIIQRADAHNSKRPYSEALMHRIDHKIRSTHHCQDALGIYKTRSNYSYRRTRSLQYRQWVWRRWNRRADYYCDMVRARRDRPGDYWIAKQIWVANQIGASSIRDPWPNCPDPYDGGGSWQDTVNCENGGSWYDSPGYYRCGLQFDPMWERKYGRLCP